MDQFLNNLQKQLNQQQKQIPEHDLNHLNLDRLVEANRLYKFFDFAKQKNWAANICFYEGKMQAFLNTRGPGKQIYDGIGETIGEALDDLLAQMK